jgi:hypothetical protein
VADGFKKVCQSVVNTSKMYLVMFNLVCEFASWKQVVQMFN